MSRHDAQPPAFTVMRLMRPKTSLPALALCLACAGDPPNHPSSAGSQAGTAGAANTGGTVAAVGGGTGTGGGGGNAGGIPEPYTPPDPCIAAGNCAAGKWVNVTPKAVSLDPNTGCNACNYGVQEVVADPVRRSDLYAFICYQGVWKSTDYGLTWSKISTGAQAQHLEAGRPWAAAIDPDPRRNQATPPTLYTVTGYGDQLGVYKSTDGGVNFQHYDVDNTQGMKSSDVYSLDVDPYDSKHLVAGFHDTGVSESVDGGVTWKTVPVPAKFGTSVFVWFVQTGSTSTSATWLTMAQWGDNTNGMWRTEDRGTKWTQVLPTLEHGHGASQIFQDGNGAIYAAGAGKDGTIFRSPDFGKTWTAVQSNDVPQNQVFGTPNYVYATLPGAFEKQEQHLQRAPTSDGSTWSDWEPTQPEGMTNGAKRAAVTYNGQHYVIVTGNWLAGIWRYVEEE